jgi:uncharacterized repeat protein (TIGR03806 family)
MKKTLFFTLVLCAVLVNISMTFRQGPAASAFKMKLSDYAFFEGQMQRQQPAPGVVPYALNAPLFSDYAHKLRFVRLPDGSQVEYNPDSVFQFPKGTAIVKTFFYYVDERDTTKGRRLMETRVLLHEQKGWVSLPYIWNEDQSDATLEVAGGDAQVTWIDAKGQERKVHYQVPNMNQCKTCHEKNGVLTPIGPSARQLNGDHAYSDGVNNQVHNQLKHWSAARMLKGLPEDLQDVPAFVDYADASKPLAQRATAYLDINCAHCHNKAGQAQTSGLFLDWKTTDKTAYGFYKTPIAAGRGSGNFMFDIDPGKPEQSILHYRMASSDPGIMMSELGKSLVHAEGVALIKEWIASLKPTSVP